MGREPENVSQWCAGQVGDLRAGEATQVRNFDAIVGGPVTSPFEDTIGLQASEVIVVTCYAVTSLAGASGSPTQFQPFTRGRISESPRPLFVEINSSEPRPRWASEPILWG